MCFTWLSCPRATAEDNRAHNTAMLNHDAIYDSSLRITHSLLVYYELAPASCYGKLLNTSSTPFLRLLGSALTSPPDAKPYQMTPATFSLAKSTPHISANSFVRCTGPLVHLLPTPSDQRLSYRSGARCENSSRSNAAKRTHNAQTHH